MTNTDHYGLHASQPPFLATPCSQRAAVARSFWIANSHFANEKRSLAQYGALRSASQHRAPSLLGRQEPGR
jgi:hypothetical protein